jgi:hypothetical protein
MNNIGNVVFSEIIVLIWLMNLKFFKHVHIEVLASLHVLKF